MGLYNRLVGTPWVYDHVRPLLTGGLDLSPAYAFDRDLSNEIIVDVGCGTGDALRYITDFREYHGFDPDERAVERLHNVHCGRDIHVCARLLTTADVTSIAPTVALMIGALHHMDDDAVVQTMNILSAGDTVRQVRTLDVQRVPGDIGNNLFIRLDRGRHVRTADALVNLLSHTSFRVAKSWTFRPTIPLPSYLVMDLVPRQSRCERADAPVETL